MRGLKNIESNDIPIGFCARINSKNLSGGYGGWRYFGAMMVAGGQWNVESTKYKSADDATNGCAVENPRERFTSHTRWRRALSNCSADVGPKLGAVWTMCGQGETFLGGRY